MRKTDVNMKELKKSLSSNYISENLQKVKITQDLMAKKIIDFSYNSGIAVMKKQYQKSSNKIQKRDLKIAKKEGKSFLEMQLNQERHSFVKQGFTESKKSRNRPQSSSYALRYSKQAISRLTTQGSCSSKKITGKNSTTRSKESYIKYLAEHKDR